MRGPECATDHYTVRSHVRLTLVFTRRKRPATSPTKKFNVRRLKEIDQQQGLAATITEALEAKGPKNIDTAVDIEHSRKMLKETVYTTSMEVLEHQTRRTPDWFQDNSQEIHNLLEEKQRIICNQLKENTDNTKAALRKVKAKVQKSEP